MPLSSRFLPVAAFVLPLIVQLSPLVNAGNSSSLLTLSKSGDLIACSNRDSGSVTLIDAHSFKKKWEKEVGRHPEGLTYVGTSTQLACCIYSDDCIKIIDESGHVIRSIDVFDEPYGIVSDKAGRYLYVTLEYPGTVIRIDAHTWAIDQQWKVGRMLRGIALAADEQSLFVTEFLTARLIQISTADGSIVNTFEGTSTDNLARQVVLHPTRPKAFVPHIRSKVSTAHGNGSIFPYVSVVTFSGEVSGRRLRVPMDTFRGTRVVANPWEVAVSPDGTQLFAAFSATNDLFVADILDDDYQELSYAATLPVGNNPRAVKVSNDGSRLLVYNALDFELVAYSLPELEKIANVDVTERPYSQKLHLGKKLFYTANQPMSGRQWISCSSCHIDGAADGRTWQQPEGLRQTQPLVGLAATFPLHWSADRDEVQDFEHTIQGQLMQGRGLLKGRLPDAMGESMTGRSRLLDALAAYTTSHDVPLSPHAKNGLSDSAKQGQKLFHSKTVGCAECHNGPYYCDSVTGQTPFRLHDIGTGRSDSSEKMGTKYDTPTLLGVYRSAPYLHDGSADSLRDVLTSANTSDQHGRTQQLGDQQIGQLIEFLRSLPFERPTVSVSGQ